MANLNPDQFNEHINRLEMEGIAFPQSGVASVGGRPLPASYVEHHGVEVTARGGEGRVMHWNTEMRIPDERGGMQHTLSLERDAKSSIEALRFHPAPDISDSPGMVWDREGKSSKIWPHYESVGSPEEFMERLPSHMRELPSPEIPNRRSNTPEPFHHVNLHHSDGQWSTEAHEYDPRSRSLTRDPENDYRP